MQKTCNEENAHVSKTCGGADGADAAAAKAIRFALPPKFKDVSALAEAYNALQAEFTRRCQRLKELEMRAEEYSGKAHTDCPSLAHPARPLRLSGTYSQM